MFVGRSRDGYYDENGNWQRSKFCFMTCHDCTCLPPLGIYYDQSKDTRRKSDGLREAQRENSEVAPVLQLGV